MDQRLRLKQFADGDLVPMIFPQLFRFADLSLLLLRLMVGMVFLTSRMEPS